MNYDFSVCKLCKADGCSPRYMLEGFSVYTCHKCGFHYTDVLDELEELPHATKEITDLTNDDIAQIEKQLQYKQERFVEFAEFCEKHYARGKTVLDIGCGGGAFLKIMQEKGYSVNGIEVNPTRKKYCKGIGLKIFDQPIESDYWREEGGEYSIVTMWDVIEHVNFPKETVERIYPHVHHGGIFALDTPSRNALFYRTGELTYTMTNGRYPTFLKTLYDNNQFGHKQIFRDNELQNLLLSTGFRDVKIYRKFQLSRPTESYVEKLFKNQSISKHLAPVFDIGVRLLRVRNKILAVAYK